MKRIELLNTPMDISTMQETLAFIQDRIDKNIFTQHVVVNVAKVVNMRADAVLKESVQNCDIINIDGMGIVFGARFLGFDVPERVAGIDLFGELIQLSAAQSYPVFLLGAQQNIVETVKERLTIKHPHLQIAGTHHGYFWDDQESVVEMIKKSKAKLLFVAITSPKKETFIEQWKDQLNVYFVMGVGGTFDVIAGKVKRAPVWMQKSGLEWLYRVIQEPRRMWKRYMVTNSKFLWLLLKEKWKTEPSDPKQNKKI